MLTAVGAWPQPMDDAAIASAKTALFPAPPTPVLTDLDLGHILIVHTRPRPLHYATAGSGFLASNVNAPFL